MIWKLLRKNISAAQIAGYALANLIGLWIIISAIHFYRDVALVLGGEQRKELVGSDFMVLSRPVSMLNTLGLGSSSKGISPDEIDDLRSQPWVAGVGEFTSANFGVKASVDFHGRGMYTYMFLESVPDAFIDNAPKEWTFDPELGLGQEVPIMVSKDYLALYNFGFASSQGLPQLNESLIATVPISLYFNGNGHADRFTGRIVGFSSRLNTVAVPKAFMDWANARYSAGPAPQPSRLIVEVSDPGNPDISRYLSRHGFEAAGDRLDQGKAAFLLKVLTTIVVGIGAIITALSLFVLMLSITLLLQKNREKNSGLLLLGYSPAQVAAAYYRLVGAVNAAVLIVAIAGMLIAASRWHPLLAELGLQPSSPVVPALWGAAIIAAITAINFLSIARAVKKAF